RCLTSHARLGYRCADADSELLRRAEKPDTMFRAELTAQVGDALPSLPLPGHPIVPLGRPDDGVAEEEDRRRPPSRDGAAVLDLRDRHGLGQWNVAVSTSEEPHVDIAPLGIGA